MKTIKLIITSLFVFTVNTQAQSFLYDETQTFTGNGYVYQADVPNGSVTLYNANNRFTYAQQEFRVTPPAILPNPDITPIAYFKEDRSTEIRAIVNSALSAQEKERLRGSNGFQISLYINPDTGRVDEVNFFFTSFQPSASIPVPVFRQIETELKNQIWVTPTEYGKKFNYILYWQRYKI